MIKTYKVLILRCISESDGTQDKTIFALDYLIETWSAGIAFREREYVDVIDKLAYKTDNRSDIKNMNDLSINYRIGERRRFF